MRAEPPPKPDSKITYEAYLRHHGVLGNGFEIHELVKPVWKGAHRYLKPPREKWPRMVITLRAAMELRERWREAGGTGLRIAAAYRPLGGSSRSQHKANSALDLDILKEDYWATTLWYQVATKWWSERGAYYSAGFGLYCAPSKRPGGIRVHIDTCWRLRTWQHWRGKALKKPAAYQIIRGNRWTYPKLNLT